MTLAWKAPANETTELIGRLRTLLLRADLDCQCHGRLCDALDRFAALETRRQSRRRLAEARDLRDRIAAILAILSELDHLTQTEADRSVFEEMALLFQDIANCAQAGAAAIRAIGSTPTSRNAVS